MKVYELITQLEKLPAGQEVAVSVSGLEDNYSIESVEGTDDIDTLAFLIITKDEPK